MGAGGSGGTRLSAERPAATHPGRRWALLLGAWSVPAAAVAGQLYVQLQAAGRPVSGWSLLAVQLARWWPWAIATPAIQALARRSRPVEIGPARSLLRLGSAALIGVPLYVAYTLIVELTIFQGVVMDARAFAARVWSSTLVNLPLNLALFIGIVVATYGIDLASDNRRRQLEAERLRSDLAEARLQALQFQLQPHFLFNTLHAIASLVDESPARARRMVGQLGELLRATLDLAEEAEVSLTQEVRLAEMYLEIERTRFEDRLAYDVAIEPGVQAARVPTLTLQPLVENAVRHGIAGRAGGGRIRIEAHAGNGELILRVVDDGAGLSTSSPRGIGTENIARRLEAIHGSRASLRLESSPHGGCVATVTVPLAG